MVAFTRGPFILWEAIDYRKAGINHSGSGQWIICFMCSCGAYIQFVSCVLNIAVLVASYTSSKLAFRSACGPQERECKKWSGGCLCMWRYIIAYCHFVAALELINTQRQHASPHVEKNDCSPGEERRLADRWNNDKRWKHEMRHGFNCHYFW